MRVEILGLNVFRPHKTCKKTKPGHLVFLLLLTDHQKLSNAINDANTKREIKDQFDYRLVRNVTVTCFQIICLDYSSHLYSRLRTNVTFLEATVAVERCTNHSIKDNYTVLGKSNLLMGHLDKYLNVKSPEAL